MLKIFKYLKPFLPAIILLIALIFAQAMVNLSLPDYMARIVNDGIVVGNNSSIYHNGGIMLLISVGGGLAAIAAGYIASVVATGLARNLREKVFTKVEGFSLVEFNKFFTASLITRSTNDIQQIQQVVVLLLRLATLAPIMGIGAIIKAYQTAPSMTWLMAVAVGALLTVIVTLFAIAIPKFQLLQKLVDRLNLVTREILTGLRVIRAFNNEPYEEKKFDAANVDLTNTNLFVNRLMTLLMPMLTLIMSGAMLAIIWVGAGYIGQGTLNIGNVMAFMQYATQAVFSFLMISMVFVLVPRAAVSGKRVAEVIETKPTITDPAKSVVPSTTVRGKIVFDHVDFKYTGADEAVLKDIAFTAEPGKTTAFVGSTGSGKTTLINLIPRFYDPTGGRITVDGVDIKDYTQEDLHAKIGYVPQKGVLFSGTIKSNIKYGAPDATDEQVVRAATVAQAADFIEKLPEGYNAPISQGGANVSGGQKQRLSIARALILNPEILIFDDSFSALDFKTDSLLRAALKKETKGKTILIVAQRISTILDADHIVVLDEGRVVGQGTHEQLMKSNEVYREIALSQLSESELKKHGISATLKPKGAAL